MKKKYSNIKNTHDKSPISICHGTIFVRKSARHRQVSEKPITMAIASGHVLIHVHNEKRATPPCVFIHDTEWEADEGIIAVHAVGMLTAEGVA